MFKHNLTLDQNTSGIVENTLFCVHWLHLITKILFKYFIWKLKPKLSRNISSKLKPLLESTRWKGRLCHRESSLFSIIHQQFRTLKQTDSPGMLLLRAYFRAKHRVKFYYLLLRSPFVLDIYFIRACIRVLF